MKDSEFISNGPFYLQHFLKIDLEQDALFRLGSVIDANEKHGDVVFTVALMKQAYLADKHYFHNEQEAGRIFVRVRCYDKQIFRFAVSYHDSGFNDDTAMIQWDPSVKRTECRLESFEQGWMIKTDKGNVVRIRPDPFSPCLLMPGKANVQFQNQDYFFTEYNDALPLFIIKKKNGPSLIGFSLAIEMQEHFCGTGERFDRIDLFGRQVDLVNENAHGNNSRRSYKNIPFLMSSRPYGLFVHSGAKMKIDIGCHSKRSLQWFVQDDHLDLFFIKGKNPGEILRNYRRITGFPPMPALWSFGAWMSRCTYLSDEQVSAVADRLRHEDYPMDVINLDTGWFAKDWQCDWTFSKERFPDPAGFFKRMAAKGFRISLWEYPYISPDVSLSQTARENSYVGIGTDPAQAVEWGDTIDFTNPEAVVWYKKLLEPLIRMGVAVLKTDFSENIDESAAYENIDAAHYRNLFSLLYQKATWEAFLEAGIKQPLLWARSGWAGSQRYPLHWSADCSSTFDGMTQSLWGGLHLGLSGFAFWSHDIPGFYALQDFLNKKPDDLLYLRWTQLGVFTSHMRFHGMTPREPWEYPKVAALVRQWLKLRYALLPYILQQAQKCCKSGLPFLRALVVDWPDDPAVWSISDQYLFGDAFLICPITDSSNERPVYLPQGRWLDFWSGRLYEGGRLLPKVKAPISRIPIYVMFGSVIPFSEPVCCTDKYRRAKKFSIRFDKKYCGFDRSALAKYIKL